MNHDEKAAVFSDSSFQSHSSGASKMPSTDKKITENMPFKTCQNSFSSGNSSFGARF